MLKLLLGHWKSHRKKPSLLPEDGDIRFEDPSTINPLFEDSDSSISSTKITTDLNSVSQNKAAFGSEIAQDEEKFKGSIIKELIDVNVPSNLKDGIIAEPVTSSEKFNPNKNNIPQTSEGETVIPLPPSSSDCIVSKPTSSEKSNSNKDTTTQKFERNTESEFSATKSEILSKTEPTVDREISAEPSTSESNPHSNIIKNTFPKDERDSVESKREEEMRLYNQPSTSAIPKDKNPDNITLNKNESSQLSETPKTNNQMSKMEKKVTTETNNLKNSTITSINRDLVDKSSLSTSAPSQIDEKSSQLTQSDQQNQSNNTEKPGNLRAKAIDELIKKFQPPDNENNSNKFLKSKRKDSFKPKEPVLVSDPPNKKELEKESLSSIFKFPPPPPLEAVKNVSSLHGRILKEKILDNSISASSKTKAIAEVSEQGKTRSDSSLERTLTQSSNKSKEVKGKLEKNETSVKKETSIKPQASSVVEKQVDTPRDNKIPPVKNSPEEQDKAKQTKTLNETAKQTKTLNETAKSSKNIKETKPQEPKIENLEEKVDKTSDKSKTNKELSKHEPEINIKKELPTLNAVFETKPGILSNNNVSSINKNKAISSTVKEKSSISKSSRHLDSVKESENVKCHSEDSGITRGDQVSSEATQDPPANGASEEAPTIPNSSKKTRKEKKLKGSNKKICRTCKRIHSDSISLKRSQYDDYYDGLTGARHLHRGKHSDSWTSDLSWEEKELLRRLRSRRGTVRSKTPSTKSRHSRHRFIDENHFRRAHNLRRSVSDDSTFHGSSLCSCDECWAHYVKEYAYGRSSLRGMPPIQEMCTCGTSRNNFLGRRVQFRSDTIHEASLSERTTRTTTPAPNPESKEETADDASSQQSSKTKESTVSKEPDGTKDKTAKVPEEAYRFVTPWELEEWDLFMRKELLKKRRRRARCMGIMALAMVVFIGLIVGILMIYLRRKVI